MKNERKILPDFSKIRLYEGETYFNSSWKIKPNKNFFTLSLRIWSPWKPLGSGKCRDWNPYFAHNSCFRSITTKVAFSDLNGLNFWVPKTNSEAQSFTRWANLNLTLVDARGVVINNSPSRPVAVQYKDESF
jgi:hypothetical protein